MANAHNLAFSDVMGLCRLAYDAHFNGEATAYDVGKQRFWRITKVFEDRSCGFRAIYATGKGGVNGTTCDVLSFAGSSDIKKDKKDWGIKGNLGNFLKGAANTEQYKLALSTCQSLKPDYLTGHSLGGGLALYCCVNRWIPTATINPSPIFDDYVGSNYAKHKNTSSAINYCTPGDLLAVGRRLAAMDTIQMSTPGEHPMPVMNGSPELQKYSVAKGTLSIDPLGATPGKRVTVKSTGKDGTEQHLLSFLVGFVEPFRCWPKRGGERC